MSDPNQDAMNNPELYYGSRIVKSESKWWCTACNKIVSVEHATLPRVEGCHVHCLHIPPLMYAAICAEQRKKDINALCAAVPPCSLRDYALAAIREGKEE